MKKYRYNKFLLVICIITLFAFFSETSYASINIVTTKAYQKWSDQTQEEKDDSIEPIPFTTNLRTSIKRSTLNQELKVLANELPEKYDLRDDITIKVKDQQNTNQCWTFSTTSIFETTIAKTKGKSLLFSPRHIEYATSRTFLNGINNKGYNREIDSGGNVYIGFNYSTAGNGPVLEADMPFENNKNKINLSEIQNKTVATKLEEYRIFPSIEKKITNNVIEYSNGAIKGTESTYTEEDVNNIRTLIKNHIMNYGAVSAYNYMGDKAQYFNTEKVNNGKANGYAYYCNDSSIVPNHAVTIVGWDDTYSADNFNDNCKPKNNGAYIALNSYGQSLFNNGYFYISYDDVLVENQMLGITKTEDVDYDNIYQYDEFGQSYQIQLLEHTNNTNLTSAYVANVYTKNKEVEGKKEYLNEISISVADTSNVEIFANVENDDKTKMVKVASPGILETGYYTIKLSTPIKITGKKFVVGAKYTNQEGVVIPVECNLSANGGNTGYWDVVTGEEGQSFLSADGTEWADLSEELKESNVCVKAFTTYEEEQLDQEIKVENINLNKNKLEMTEEECTNLEVAFNPSNATNKNVKWTTEDSNIVSVDERGNIKAIKEGKTIIIATSEDGNKIAKCEVVVKNKQSSDDDIYYEDNKAQMNVGQQNKHQEEIEINGNSLDQTIAKSIIPYAGNNTIIIITIVVIMGIGIYTYIKIKKYKDVR